MIAEFWKTKITSKFKKVDLWRVSVPNFGGKYSFGIRGFGLEAFK